MLVNVLQEVELDDSLILSKLNKLGISKDSVIKAYNNLQTGKCNVTKIRVLGPSPNIKESFVYQIIDPELEIKYYVSTNEESRV